VPDRVRRGSLLHHVDCARAKGKLVHGATR
jgi:hypothetical protein